MRVSTSVAEPSPRRTVARKAGAPSRRSARGRNGAKTAPSPAGTVALATGTGFGSVVTAMAWRSRTVRAAALVTPSGARARVGPLR